MEGVDRTEDQDNALKYGRDHHESDCHGRDCAIYGDDKFEFGFYQT